MACFFVLDMLITALAIFTSGGFVTEREAYVALNMMEKVGPVGVQALIECLGSASAIFGADASRLTGVNGIRADAVNAILNQKETIDWQGELDRAESMGAHIVTRIDEEYPQCLREIHDPPLALYVRGTMESRDSRSIAIVGSRRSTYYGNDTATSLAGQLAMGGFTVVSGLAQGIDTCAHRSAIDAGGRTLAVTGGGLDHIFPPSNKKLAEEISEHGALISEFSFGRRPDKTTFPMRNRIISGLSVGVIVVEAGERSGSLITANQALQQGRDVFAVPGRIDSRMSKGTNNLIKNGAAPVTCAEDVFSEYNVLFSSSVKRRSIESVGVENLSAEEKLIMSAVEKGERNVDAVIRESGLKPSAVGGLLLQMEMKRVIRMLPGRMVEACRS